MSSGLPLYHDSCHTQGMPEKIVRARLDDESRFALRLMVRMGMTESEAVRTALVEAAEARSTEEALRAECERLMQDKEAMAREMAEFHEWEKIRAPWPD
jgi:hypothetical protein